MTLDEAMKKGLLKTVTYNKEQRIVTAEGTSVKCDVVTNGKVEYIPWTVGELIEFGAMYNYSSNSIYLGLNFHEILKDRSLRRRQQQAKLHHESGWQPVSDIDARSTPLNLY